MLRSSQMGRYILRVRFPPAPPIACVYLSFVRILPSQTFCDNPYLSQVRSSKRAKCGACQHMICGKMRAMNL